MIRKDRIRQDKSDRIRSILYYYADYMIRQSCQSTVSEYHPGLLDV
jgi:hypothetical protein